MNPYNSHDLQVPVYTPDGYRLTTSIGEEIILSPGGDYSDQEFTEIDLSFLTICANFSRAKFTDCLFNLSDFSGSNFSQAVIDECIINESAFMWTIADKLTINETNLNEVRFAYANLRHSKVSAILNNVNFDCANLSSAKFTNSKIFDCELNGANCRDLTIEDSLIKNLAFLDCDLQWFTITSSLAEQLVLKNSNLAGSHWNSVASMRGNWRFTNVDFSMSKFIMCHSKDVNWSKVNLFGVVMERCNWWKSILKKCDIEESTFVSVGWNDSVFEKVIIANTSASAQRLRFTKFDSCLIFDSVFADSAWEFCELWSSEVENFSVVQPTYCDGTEWHYGYCPDSSPHPLETPTSE